MEYHFLLKFSLFALICFGCLGTSCISTSGYLYKEYNLESCPPIEYMLPLYSESNGNRVEIESKPSHFCPKFSSYQFSKEQKRLPVFFYSSLKRNDKDCSIVVAFPLHFEGLSNYGKNEYKKSYTYEVGNKNIDSFAKTIISGTRKLTFKNIDQKERFIASDEIAKICDQKNH